MVQVEKYLQEFTDRIVAELPNIISASVVDLLNGKVLAYKDKNMGGDNRDISSHQAEVVKYALKGMDYIEGVDHHKFKDITITLDNQIHIIYTSKTQRMIVYLIMERKGANLGLAGILKNKLYDELFAQLKSEATEQELANHPLLVPVDVIYEEEKSKVVSEPTSSDSNSSNSSGGGFFRRLFSNN